MTAKNNRNSSQLHQKWQNSLQAGCLTGCLLGLCSTQVFAGADTFIDFEATLGLDDNVTRAADNQDIEYDGFLTVNGTGGHMFYAGPAGLLSGHIQLGVNQFFRFNGLSNLVAAGKIKYANSFGNTFNSPWYSVEGEYGVAEFESFLRDSNIARANLTLGMNIDDATTIRVGTSFKDRDAESAVFDTQTVSAFVNLDWTVVRRHVVYTTYKYETGDTFSSITPGLGRVAEITAVVGLENIAIDDVFDGKVTYKLDADMHFLTLGYNWIQSLHSSFDFSAQFLQASATEVDLDYSDLVLRATYFHRFNF